MYYFNALKKVKAMMLTSWCHVLGTIIIIISNLNTCTDNDVSALPIFIIHRGSVSILGTSVDY